MKLGRVRRLINSGLVGLLLSCGTEPIAPPTTQPPQEKPPAQQPGSYVVSPKAENPLIAVSENSLTFAQPIPCVVGDIFAADTTKLTPRGLMRKATSCSSDKKTAYTTTATIEEVVKEGSISLKGIISQTPSYSFMMKGISLIPNSEMQQQGFGISLKDVAIGGFLLNGTAEIGTVYDLNAQIKSVRLNYLLFKNTSSIISDISVSSKNPGSSLKERVTIGEYYFTPIVVISPTGLPIVVTPKMGFYGEIDASQINPLSVGVGQIANLAAELKYDGAWHASGSLINTFKFSNPVTSGQWKVKASVKPELTLLFGGVVGLTAGVSAGLGLETTLQDWTLTGNMGAGFGVSIEFIKQIAAYYKDFVTYEKILAQGKYEEPPAIDTTFTDSRDGKTYKLVKIGNQTWMAENLNYAAIGSEYYQNNSSFGSIYGRLYDFNSLKTACPSGWHLPTVNEWKTLSDYLGGIEVSGGKLKATGTKEAGTGRWYSPNTGATNESGFSAQPGGKKGDETFSREGSEAHFWAADDIYATSRFFTYLREGMNYFTSPYPEGLKFSVRCAKN